MKTREQALTYGLSFPDTYQDAPFHDENWQLVRYKGNRKAFLWTYEKNGHINLNVKADPEKALFWREIHASVLPGYHQNKDHWNTVILDGSTPDTDIRIMIAESYDLIADSPSKHPATIPCHRVVNAKGELAGNYAFGGAWKQAELLVAEGVEVIDGRVDLKKYSL